MIGTLAGRMQGLFSALQGQSPRFGGSLDDLRLINSSIAFAATQPGVLDYYWFEVEEQRTHGPLWHGFRVVKLAELTYLPQDARKENNLIKKEAAIRRALAAAGIEQITLSFGMFENKLGVIQCYGVSAFAATLEEAVARAGAHFAALVANYSAQYPQIRLTPLTSARASWLTDAFDNMPHVTSIIGQPDPREGPRGGAQQKSTQNRGGQYSEQQNEHLFRAMAKAREEFVTVIIGTPVPRSQVARMQASLANLTSPIAGRQQGSTGFGFGVSLPVLVSAAQGLSTGQNFGTSQSQSESHSTGISHGTASSDGVADTASWSHTVGTAHSEGVAHSNSVTHSSGTSHGWGVSQGTSDSTSQSHSQGVADTASWSHATGSSQSHGVTNSTSSSSSVSGGTSVSDGTSTSESVSLGSSLGGGVSLSPGGVGVSSNAGVNTSASMGQGTSHGVSSSAGWSNTSTSGQAVSDVSTTSVSDSVGGAHSVSSSDSVGTSHGVSAGASENWGTSESTSVGQATTLSSSDTSSESSTTGGAHTVSHSNSVSDSQSMSQGVAYGVGQSLARSIGASQAMGLSAGVAPSASWSKSFLWKDENAIALTELLEEQLSLLKEAAEEGGVYSDVYILTRTKNGRSVAETAAIQAFGGSQGVVTHVLPRRPASNAEEDHLRRHARCMVPSMLTETLGFLNGYAYSTMVTPTQHAAYTAPGLFEEGSLVSVQEATPPFAMYVDMPGEVMLGYQFSTERGEQTDVPVRLTESRHFHTLFAADTGFGKTVAAERMALEVAERWHHRVVVLDFGAGWRKLLNASLPKERVDFYTLYPGGIRPLRWNFLRVGRRIDPETQIAATAEIFCEAGRMGPRQIGILKRALRELYLAEGVISQPAHRRAAQGQQQSKPEGVLTDLDVAELLAARVRYGRGGNTSLQVGQLVTTLAPFDRQSLAVHRSKMVTMTGLYARLEQIHQMMDPRDQNRQALEGLLLRLDVFQQGTLAEMFSDENGLAIEELGYLGEEPAIADRWGLTILEGGAMDEYGKIVLLGLAAWHLYQDAVARRREAVGGQYNRPLDIIFEEANKILGGASSAGEGEGGTVGGNDRQFQVMWRDGRKYGIFLHPLLQTVHELPAGIMASCTNAFFGQLKNLKDRDLALGHLAWSEKGFTDEEYKRFMSRIPIAQAICKLGYTQDVALLQPMLIRPLMVPATEPNDAQVEEIFSKPTELKTSSVPAGVAVPPRV